MRVRYLSPTSKDGQLTADSAEHTKREAVFYSGTGDMCNTRKDPESVIIGDRSMTR